MSSQPSRSAAQPAMVPTDALHGWVSALFSAAGSNATECQLLADHLVGANLAGHDSHGVGMVPRYVNSLLGGELNLNTQVQWAVDSGAILVADGGLGMGQSVAHQAMSRAIERAGEQGICLLGLRNAHHIGRVGHWAEMAVAHNLVSIHFTNAMSSTPGVAPFGGIDARFVTNPFTVGIPHAGGQPIVLDFATSAIAAGKVRVAYNKGVTVPPGSLIDNDGEPTDNPAALYEEPLGALRTFAEHKGYALAMVCELLGAAMTGGPTMRPENFAKGAGVWNNMMAIVFDPARMNATASYEREAAAFIEWVQSARLDKHGQTLGSILVPGDPERRMREARAKAIPIDAGTMREMDEAARLINEASHAAIEPLSSLQTD